MSTLDLEDEMDQYICKEILEHIRDDKVLDFNKLVEEAKSIYDDGNTIAHVRAWVFQIADDNVEAVDLRDTEEKPQ